MKSLALLNREHILPKTDHVTALVVVKAVVISLGTGQGAVDSPLDSHRGHVDNEDASAGRDIALGGSDSAIGTAIINAIG